ncbi:MAG: RNA polymerase sigma factor, partial [Vulcanimicrobiaceae bacterium]
MSAVAPLLVEAARVPTLNRTEKRSSRPAGPTAIIPSTDNFERVVAEFQRRLYGFALRMTGNREDAEEIVQDAFVRAFRALGKMSPE